MASTNNLPDLPGENQTNKDVTECPTVKILNNKKNNPSPKPTVQVQVQAQAQAQHQVKQTKKTRKSRLQQPGESDEVYERRLKRILTVEKSRQKAKQRQLEEQQKQQEAEQRQQEEKRSQDEKKEEQRLKHNAASSKCYYKKKMKSLLNGPSPPSEQQLLDAILHCPTEDMNENCLKIVTDTLIEIRKQKTAETIALGQQKVDLGQQEVDMRIALGQQKVDLGQQKVDMFREEVAKSITADNKEIMKTALDAVRESLDAGNHGGAVEALRAAMNLMNNS